MKIVHVVPHIDDEASGPSYSVPRLCEALALRGHDVELTCLAAREPIPGVRVDVHSQWPIFDRFAISTSHALALRRKAAEVDIVHNHSLWSMVNVTTGWVVPGRRAKLVTSPRGTLSRWALDRRRSIKRVLWPLQRRALTRADLLHATSEAEYKEIRQLGLEAPVAIVPNGVDIPALLSRSSNTHPRTLLFLGRIHPKKGLDLLLQAWSHLQDRHSNWRLVVAGRGELPHERNARDMAAKLRVRRVEFIGPRYGSDKSNTYRSADLFVLPSHSENFGMTVAEALAHGCPAVVSKGAPWSGLETEGCGWWVEHDLAALEVALRHAMSVPPEKLTDMGSMGRHWMERDYSWSTVAQRMEEAYQWILGVGPMPMFARPD